MQIKSCYNLNVKLKKLIFFSTMFYYSKNILSIENLDNYVKPLYELLHSCWLIFSMLKKYKFFGGTIFSRDVLSWEGGGPERPKVTLL